MLEKKTIQGVGTLREKQTALRTSKASLKGNIDTILTKSTMGWLVSARMYTGYKGYAGNA